MPVRMVDCALPMMSWPLALGGLRGIGDTRASCGLPASLLAGAACRWPFWRSPPWVGIARCALSMVLDWASAWSSPAGASGPVVAAAHRQRWNACVRPCLRRAQPGTKQGGRLASPPLSILY
jgi:hypothetical protein